MSDESLPAGWALTQINQVATNYSGNSKLIKGKLSQDPGEGLYPAFSASGQDVWHSEYGEEGMAIIVSAVGARCGKVFRASGKWSAIANTHVVKINPIAGHLNYFYYLLNREHYWVKGGSAQPFVRTKATFERPFPLPPLAEQKRIVAKIEELFSELDAGEESLRRARRQLGVYRQSLLKQAFEGKLTAPWRAQHPDLLEPPEHLLARIQAERQARYQQQLKEWEKAAGNGSKPRKPPTVSSIPADEAAHLEPLPPGWTWIPFSAVCDFLNGDRSKNYPNRSEYVENGIAWINTGHIEPDGSLSAERMNFISREKFDSLSGGRIKPGDLVYCLRGATFGKTAFVSPYTEGAVASSLMIVRPINPDATPFIYRYLVSPLGKEQLQRFDNGSAQPNLSAASVALYHFPLCSLPEQQEIVRLLDEQFTVIDQNEREIDAALKRSEALRQSILKKAFTGQLVPQDPTDEPASTLLERIRAEREATATKKPKKKAAGKRTTRHG